MSTRRHLRDSAEICPEHINIPGEGPLRCELDAGHEGKHKHFCTWWGTPGRAGAGTEAAS